MKNLLTCCLLSLALVACQNTDSRNIADNKAQDSSANMAQFASDKAFQQSHEIPAPLDFEGKGTWQTFNTPDGRQAKAYVLKADNNPENRHLFVIHEWWGLNEHILQEAENLFDSLGNVSVWALDMYDGLLATTPEKAGEYMGKVTDARAEAIIQGAFMQAGDQARIGTIGWCFGGGWSLRASILAAKRGKACVIYYGMPVQEAKQLAPLQAPVLGVFAAQDAWITPAVVDDFAALCKATGKDVTVNMFEANHAFANPSSPRYNETAAQEANQSALAFLRKNL